jgi:hypothetical protein
MSRNSANFLLIVGLLITLGGVGGIDNSIETQDLVGALLVSMVGMATMWCGLLATRVLDSQDL